MSISVLGGIVPVCQAGDDGKSCLVTTLDCGDARGAHRPEKDTVAKSPAEENAPIRSNLSRVCKDLANVSRVYSSSVYLLGEYFL